MGPGWEGGRGGETEDSYTTREAKLCRVEQTHLVTTGISQVRGLRGLTWQEPAAGERAGLGGGGAGRRPGGCDQGGHEVSAHTRGSPGVKPAFPTANATGEEACPHSCPVLTVSYGASRSCKLHIHKYQ